MLERGEIHLCISLLQGFQADDGLFGMFPVPPLELLAACHPSFRLERGSMTDIGRIVSYPLLLQDSGFVVRKTFDAVCRLARLKPEHSDREPRAACFASTRRSRAWHRDHSIDHTDLSIPLRIVRITYKRKPLRDPQAVVWDKRRVLPRYAKDFCELLAAHMRKLFPIRPLSAPKVDGAAKTSRSWSRHKGAVRIKLHEAAIK